MYNHLAELNIKILMTIVLILILAILASLGGFVVHVITIEWLPQWIGAQMQGITIQPSWDVRYLAAVTSIEYGLAAIGLYYLGRQKLLSFGKLKSALIFSILLMAISGVFIRQPLMDIAIGNPLHVSLLQNAFKWLPWIIMAFVVVFGFELIQKTISKTTKTTHFQNNDPSK